MASDNYTVGGLIAVADMQPKDGSALTGRIQAQNWRRKGKQIFVRHGCGANDYELGRGGRGGEKLSLWILG